METNEETKLFMDFMEIKESSASYDNYGKPELVYFMKNPFFRTYSYRIPDLSINEFLREAKYKTSWEWLMEVVEKIESLGYQFKTCRRKVEIYSDLDFHLILTSKEETKKESVYQACLKFIIWYNDHK